MAQKTVVTLVDDISGEDIKEGKGETVRFALDGQAYEIDLTLKNADKLRGVILDYVASARKVGRATGKAGARTRSSNAKEIRDWARSNGMDVPDRGRIPANVMEAWESR